MISFYNVEYTQVIIKICTILSLLPYMSLHHTCNAGYKNFHIFNYVRSQTSHHLIIRQVNCKIVLYMSLSVKVYFGHNKSDTPYFIDDVAKLQFEKLVSAFINRQFCINTNIYEKLFCNSTKINQALDPKLIQFTWKIIFV